MKYDVAVIGGGLAGICCAFSFARRGLNSCIIEKTPQIALGASGNADGMLAPYFDNALSPRAKLYQAGFKLSLDLLAELAALGHQTSFRQHGVIQLPSVSRVKSLLLKEKFNSDADLQVQKLNAAEASTLSGIELKHPALYFPQAGSITPRILCQNLLTASKSQVEIVLCQEVLTMTQDGSGWRLDCKSGLQVQSKYVVLANAYAANNLSCARGLILNKIRGQVLQVPASAYSSKLKTAISYDGYIIPARNDLHIIGASYANKSFGPQNAAAESEHINQRLEHWMPELAQSLPSKLSGRASFRTNSLDRLPYVGELPETAGIYVSLAHGSRGLITCYLASELICAKLLSPKESSILGAELLSPIRSINISKSYAAA